MKKNRFTLTELLIVAAALTLLVTVMVPLLHAAGETAQSTDCLNHQKQVGVWTQNYIKQSDGFLPPCYDKTFTSDAGGNYSYWHYLLYTKNIGPITVNMGLPGAKLNTEVFLCELGKPEERAFHTDFAYNLHFGRIEENGMVADNNSPKWQKRRLTDIAKPAAAMMVTDAAPKQFFFYWDASFDNVSYRHGGRSNVLFVDGHSVPLTKAEITPEMVHGGLKMQ